MPKKRAPVAQSIEDFMRAKDRAECPVCQLPADVQEQLRIGREKYKIREQIDYLDARGFRITTQALLAHRNKRHDDA